MVYDELRFEDQYGAPEEDSIQVDFDQLVEPKKEEPKETVRSWEWKI